MVVLEKGQLSYLILSCLSEKDMYGLELIEEIKKRAGIEIKLPSLYSNLNRMKELKFISSYLKESTKGPKCAYSSITENGRKELEKLSEIFGNKVETPIVTPVTEEKLEISKEIEEKIEVKQESFENYNDFFADIPSEDSPVSIEEPIIEEIEEVESPVEEKQEEIITNNETEIEESFEESVETPILEEKTEEIEEKKDDAVFLSQNEINDYNQKLFDASRDYNKYKNKKSFSENQIGMAVNETAPLAEKNDRLQENINGIKEALLQKRQGIYEEVKLPEESKSEIKAEPKYEEKSVVDDGVFITDRVIDIPKSRRFEPPRLNILVNQDNTPLPAPKRDVAIDPNCSDVKAKIEALYSKSKASTSQDDENKENIIKKSNVEFENFNDLKEYYNAQDITFKVFKRSEKRALHNTNKVKFYVDLIIFGLLSFASGMFYLLFSKLGLTNANTNFFYYLFPIMYAVYLAVRLYMYKKVQSKVPRPLFNFIVVFGGTLLLSGLAFCVNLACGMSINNILACSTTVFMPIVFFIIVIIIRHYIMLFALKKYWR